MDTIEALRRSGDEYRRRLVAVKADQWEQASVCDGWTVKDLADHVLGGNRFAVPLLDGESSEAAFSLALAGGFDGDVIDDFDVSMAAQLEAFEAPGALEVEVQHPSGPTSAATFAGLRTGDLLLHGWDLARSCGGEEDLDDELVAEVWRVYEPRISSGTNRAGAFGDGPTGTYADNAPLARRLLDLTGRRP